MLEVMKSEMKLNDISFTEHRLTIEDAEKLFENDGWIAIK